MLDLRIHAIENKDALHHPLVPHKVLPQHEFSMLIVAPKGSGKTNFICNMLLNHYKGYFHKILVCSPTIENDDKWDVVKKTKHILAENKGLEKALTTPKDAGKTPKAIGRIVFKSADDAAKHNADKVPFTGKIPEEDFFSNLNEVPERIKKQQNVIHELRQKGYGQKSKFIADRMLVVLDDQAGMFRSGNTNNPMVNYVIKHRHASSSVIIVTQAYKAIPKTIRTNCNALILFEIPNRSELRVIYEENPEGLDEDAWVRVYQYATREPFSFLYSNNKFKKGERLFLRFERLLRVVDQQHAELPPAASTKQDGMVTENGSEERPYSKAQKGSRPSV